jgi:glycosyltransferase involved in cell wall biosynthesis
MVNTGNIATSRSKRLSVLLVPDWQYWILGTIAKGIARANPWMDATIISGSILDDLHERDPDFFDRFDLVHFICPYASKRWLDHLGGRVPVVTSHHHVTEWDAVSHNIHGDAIIAGSLQWVDDIVARGAEASRVVSVPYGVDSNLFVPASVAERDVLRARLGLSHAGPIVGFFAKRGSNDDDRKGIDVFAKAIKSLRETEKDVAVLIVGPGWGELVEEFMAARITCVWIPFLEALSAVAELYRALDFYWVTARVEGGPVPLLEAMSSGICVLTTRVGLAREIVENHVNGIFLEMNDPAAFAAETVRLWHDRKKMDSMAQEARRSIVAKMHVDHTLQGVAVAYDRAFENFLRRTGKAGRSASPALNSEAPIQNQDVNSTLYALRPAERRRVQAMEALSWSEHLLIYQGQRRAAARLIVHAWRMNPRSTEPARALLRHFLPAATVRRLVSLKRAVSRS